MYFIRIRPEIRKKYIKELYQGRYLDYLGIAKTQKIPFPFFENFNFLSKILSIRTIDLIYFSSKTPVHILSSSNFID